MKSLLLAYKFFRKHVIANLLVVIMTILMLYISTLAYNQYNTIYTQYNFFEKSQIRNSFLFMGRESVSDEGMELIDNSYLDEMIPMLQENKAVLDISTICYFSAATSTNTYNDIFIYDQITADMLRKGFSFTGEWPWEKSDQDPLPMIVRNGQNDQYKTGDIVELTVYASSPFVSINNPIENSEIKVRCEVVGIVSEVSPFPLFFATKTNSPTSISNLLRHYSSPNTTAFFMPYRDQIFSKYKYSSDAFIIYTNESASQEEISSLEDSIKNFGYLLTGNEVLDATKSEADFQFHKNFFVFYTLVGLVIISFFSVSFLNVKRLARNFAIFGVLGATQPRKIWTYQLYFVSMYIFSFLSFLLVITIQHIFMQSSSDSLSSFRSYIYDLDPKMAFSIGLFGFVLVFIFSWIPFVFYRGKTSIDLLREK